MDISFEGSHSSHYKELDVRYINCHILKCQVMVSALKIRSKDEYSKE